MIGIQSDFEALREALSRRYPASVPRLTLYPSGGAMLDVKVGDETYVLEYHLRHGVGLNRLSQLTFAWEGYEWIFGTCAEAQTFLFSVLAEHSAT